MFPFLFWAKKTKFKHSYSPWYQMYKLSKSDITNDNCTLFYLSNEGTQPLMKDVWPSYSRQPALFGHIVAKIHEAWQSVSTISRSKLKLHKSFPNTTKTIWVYGKNIYWTQDMKSKPRMSHFQAMFWHLWLVNIYQVEPGYFDQNGSAIRSYRSSALQQTQDHENPSRIGRDKCILHFL
jgi:hypothetical protein